MGLDKKNVCIRFLTVVTAIVFSVCVLCQTASSLAVGALASPLCFVSWHNIDAQ